MDAVSKIAGKKTVKKVESDGTYFQPVKFFSKPGNNKSLFYIVFRSSLERNLRAKVANCVNSGTFKFLSPLFRIPAT